MEGIKEISIDDREKYIKYLRKSSYEASDLNFTNLFIWKHIYPNGHMIIDDYLCIFVEHGGPPYVLMPAGQGDLKNVIEKLINKFSQEGIPFCMKGITHNLRNEMENLFPNIFKFEERRDIFDYVYLSEDLINLEGRKYHSKRNYLNRFIENYDFSYESLSKDNIKECIDASEQWYKNKDLNNGLIHERTALNTAFEYYQQLGYKGGLLKVDGQVIALTIGELLNSQMAVIHFEKADTDFVGSYQAINQMFCEHEWSNIQYINREEDLGVKGLRKAKKSYKPVKMIKKYNACLR